MNTNHQKTRIESVLLVLLVSGLIGFFLGAFVFPTMQYCVQYGQVLAGIVKYPFSTPEGLVMRHYWSLPNQLSAIGLLAGLSEPTLSILFSGVLGMLSFQALALFMFTISNRLLVSVLAPGLFFFSAATFFGDVYPVKLMSHFATHGILGLAYILLSAAMIGAGRNRFAALLFGMAPALHIVLGAFLWFIFLLAWFIPDWKGDRINLKVGLWFLAGVLICAISFCVHFINIPPMPDVSAEEIHRHLLFYVQNWDFHRRPRPFFTAEIMLNLLGWAVCFAYLRKNSSVLPERTQLMFRMLLVAGALAVLASLAMHLPLTWMPLVVPLAMPARTLSLFVLIYPALMLGILARENGSGIEQLFATVLIVLLLIAKFGVPHYSFEVMKPFILGTLVLSGVMIIGIQTTTTKYFNKSADSRNFKKACKISQILLLSGITLSSFYVYRSKFSLDAIREAQTQAYRRTGIPAPDILLVASTFERAQYLTRRPVLLDPALDSLCYAPKLAPLAASILQDVYGTDFFDPPPAARHTSALLPGAERALWEARALKQWQELANKYRMVDVLVPQDWKLQLPVIQRGGGAVIYHIPAK